MSKCNCGACAESNWHGENGLFKCSQPKKPVTVTHEGNVYEIGQSYLFSDDGVKWHAGNLVSLDSEHEYLFRWDACGFKKIKKLKASSLGTITPAPIQLVDNAPYMFEVGGSKFLGFYETSQEAFFDRDDGGEEVAKLSDCTNIRHMTVAESK
jgi:hypothetical protein